MVIAYPTPFGGLLLLAGRFGDLLGQRRIFLIGLAVFTVDGLRTLEPELGGDVEEQVDARLGIVDVNGGAEIAVAAAGIGIEIEGRRQRPPGSAQPQEPVIAQVVVEVGDQH